MSKNATMKNYFKLEVRFLSADVGGQWHSQAIPNVHGRVFSPQDLCMVLTNALCPGVAATTFWSLPKGNQQHDGFWWPDPGLKTEVSGTQADTGVLRVTGSSDTWGLWKAISRWSWHFPIRLSSFEFSFLCQLLSSSFTLRAAYPEKPQHTREQTFIRALAAPPRCHGAGKFFADSANGHSTSSPSPTPPSYIKTRHSQLQAPQCWPMTTRKMFPCWSW